MRTLRVACMLAGFLSLALSLPAQTFTTLHSFDLNDGDAPAGALVQATNGSLYGTTYEGGGLRRYRLQNHRQWRVHAAALLRWHGWQSAERGIGAGTGGNLYGTTSGGGANIGGTVFEITSNGTLTTLYNFCSQVSQGDCADGSDPLAGLVQGTNGNFYGTTNDGGANNAGTVFEITPSGTLTTLYSFCAKSGCSDGENPSSGLVQAANGDFYGTTSAGGGDSGDGTVFKVSPTGMLTKLHSFDGVDGSTPFAGLVQATNGNFYGMTNGGGAHGYGTVFEITPGGTLTSLYSFCSQSGCTDGIEPYAVLLQATDGNLYGTTYSGGANNFGTIFEITPSGALTTLYNFCSQSGCADGGRPFAGVIQDTNGSFYGATSVNGNTSGYGTVFSLSVGLGAFVKTQTTSGKVGAAVNILGTNLTGATAVTFNGTQAVFKVVSSSEITAKVPAGAATGEVKVVTLSGTLAGNQVFRVIP